MVKKRLVVYMECHQTLFLVEINLKGNNKEILNFWPKPWTNRFKKASFLYRTSPNTFYWRNVPKRKGKRNFKFLTKTIDWPLLKNATFVTSLNGYFNGEKRLVFYLESRQTMFIDQIWLNRKNKAIWNFWPKPWTNHLGKIQILRRF